MKEFGNHLVTDKEFRLLKTTWSLVESENYTPGKIIKIRRVEGQWRYGGNVKAKVLFRYFTSKQTNGKLLRFYRTRVKLLESDWEGSRVSISN